MKHWLDRSLTSAIDEQFFENGIVGQQEKRNFLANFATTIPVFYPVSPDTSVDFNVMERKLYVGSDENLANDLGFNAADTTQQFKQDASIGNRFFVCRLVVGRNFFDYSGFNSIKAFYESDLNHIMNQERGCHIHKDFVGRNIDAAYEKRVV